jgi:SAM-dependent methyltransferase
MSDDESPGARDIADYERAYRESDFEVTQARFRKRMLLELLERERPRRVLEVGCGLDTLANHWTGAERFIVVEPGPDFARQAREDTAGRADVDVIEATLEAALARLPLGFDVILVSGLLHELVETAPLLEAVRGLCGPTTLVHANVPNARSFHRLLAVEMGLIAAPDAISDMQKALQQHRTFDIGSLVALVAAYGFRVDEQGSYFVKPFTHGQMAQLQGQGLVTDAMLEGLWRMTRHMPDLGSEIFVNMRAAA